MTTTDELTISLRAYAQCPPAREADGASPWDRRMAC